MPVRKLSLKKETLVELSTDELTDVNGAAQTPQCPTNYCYPTWYTACRLSDLLADCPSNPFC